MKEITFKIGYDKEMDCDKVTILEDGVVATSSYYHKGTDYGVMLVCTAVDWYGVDLNTLYE